MNSDQYQIKRRKKLIEVAIPLDAINDAAIREKSIRHGHPSTLHLWWARRPLAASRAVIFCQIVDDPSSIPEKFPTVDDQQKERQILFSLIIDLVKWENLNNTTLIERARGKIKESWQRCCIDNKNHPEASIIFNPKKLPKFYDPFAGGGSIPLEAHRLGLEAYANDLNPVAVLINKAMIEIPFKFIGNSPINPSFKNNLFIDNPFRNNALCLAEDLDYYGKLLKEEAKKRIGFLYPKIKITQEIILERPDLAIYKDREFPTICYIWTRTVKSPNPTFSEIHVPLASNFVLSSKVGCEAYVEPIIKKDGYEFHVRKGKSQNMGKAKQGTKLARGANFYCVMSNTPIEPGYIKKEGLRGGIEEKLMAVVIDCDNKKVYLSPSKEQESIAKKIKPTWKSEIELSKDRRALWTPIYGLTTFGQLFTNRQLVMLNTFSDLIEKVKNIIEQDAIKGMLFDDKLSLCENGSGARAYSEAIALYLSFIISRLSDFNSSVCGWIPVVQATRNTFARQGIPMSWDFAELNPFSKWLASFDAALKKIVNAQKISLPSDYENIKPGVTLQDDAASSKNLKQFIVSTDPPYYDNIGYADLSDFFYVWLRKCIKDVFPELFSTITVPKNEELVAVPHRHANKQDAEEFFLKGMTKVMSNLALNSNEAFPLTIYYAFKQTENKQKDGDKTSTGWETFLKAIIDSGLSINGTWPLRTELSNRMVSSNANALTSSIVLVCQKRDNSAKMISRNEFRRRLRVHLPKSIYELESSNIAPVDIAQVAIGPGMSIFSQAKAVLNPDDSSMTVHEALLEVNFALNEYLSKDDSEFDIDTLFAITFFESYGYTVRPFGDAEGLAKARNVSVEGIVQAGILNSVAGKVNLISREKLSEDWDPLKDNRLCIWEATQYLIKKLELEGESGASKLLNSLNNCKGIGDITYKCRSLAYRLFNHCEKTNQFEEARSYNSLIIAWPELERIGAEKIIEPTIQTKLI